MTDGVLVKLQYSVAEMFNWVKKKGKGRQLVLPACY